ncbi:hypothetical protein [Amnibacterium kyonggiense]|uniref:Uncharacterized protein n=1 Tax=Amnibacterium kyonggiense TaxID=595671 RepID=A0A4R7FLA2_9MICO|nr:hypothetical protein [Amnibacterium kyonggiense]TDS77156.1 hypothetical protein CLV52_2096 [Amnibacterium kyonggiense]
MTGPGTTETRATEALRRRLYAPGATAEDLVAFRAAEATARPPALSPVRRRRPRTAAVLAAAVVAIAAPLALVTLRPLAAVPVATGPTPTATAVPSPEGVVLPAPQSVRAAFVRQLASRSGAGLLEYLYGHPAFLPEALRQPTRGHVTETAGDGPRTLDLSPSTGDGPAGRLTVVIVVERAARIFWTATGRTGDAALHRRLDAPAGVPVSATVAYKHGAPTTLEIEVPEGSSWGALVALTN